MGARTPSNYRAELLTSTRRGAAPHPHRHGTLSGGELTGERLASPSTPRTRRTSTPASPTTPTSTTSLTTRSASRTPSSAATARSTGRASTTSCRQVDAALDATRAGAARGGRRGREAIPAAVRPGHPRRRRQPGPHGDPGRDHGCSRRPTASPTAPTRSAFRSAPTHEADVIAVRTRTRADGRCRGAAVGIRPAAPCAVCGDADGSGGVSLPTASARSVRAAALADGCEPPAATRRRRLVSVADGERVQRAAAGLDGVARPSGLVPDPLSGGATTVFDTTRNAFGQPARICRSSERTDFFVGNALFNRNWVTAPSSTTGSDGLGPLLQRPLLLVAATSATAAAGRRSSPTSRSSACCSGSASRARTRHGGPLAEPAYGGQLNQQAILGVPPEGHAARHVRRSCPGTYGDGEPYSLRMPSYAFVELAYGPLDARHAVSPRTAPFMIGLGLLAALDEATILARADPDDADGDGISGRPNASWTAARRRPSSAASAGRPTSRRSSSRPPARSSATSASPRRCSRSRTARRCRPSAAPRRPAAIPRSTSRRSTP